MTETETECRSVADALETLWPLLLAFQKQGLLELKIEQRGRVPARNGTAEPAQHTQRDSERGTLRHTQRHSERDTQRHTEGDTVRDTERNPAEPVQGHVRLTAPRGFLVADGITAEIWSALEKHRENNTQTHRGGDGGGMQTERDRERQRETERDRERQRGAKISVNDE